METSTAPAARPSTGCARHVKPEEAEIRSLAVPIRDPSAALHSGKAEKQQLLQNVINDLHEAYLEKLGMIPTRKNREILRKNLKLWKCHISVSWSPGGREAVAQEVIVDFPYAKRQEAPEQKDATGTPPEYETIVCRQTHRLKSLFSH
ncbi:hypothetical protein EBH_0064130 [Eimeria brunetti]|uniref:Uncharacterized protein n=1 Tax=Eimeria brunetti TaxID=51314 RepID=U6LE90_9EIME|nr:hypothetical protein EBH_0064130 [Eimeria brunetti]